MTDHAGLFKAAKEQYSLLSEDEKKVYRVKLEEILHETRLKILAVEWEERRRQTDRNSNSK